jgi:hypothetical protein
MIENEEGFRCCDEDSDITLARIPVLGGTGCRNRCIVASSQVSQKRSQLKMRYIIDVCCNNHFSLFI